MSSSESVPRAKISSVMPGFGTADMTRAIDFYTTKLGFRVTFRNGAVFTIVARDGIEISLALHRSGTPPVKNACYLKVEGIDAFHDEFTAKGVTMAHPLKIESYGMRELMIIDPDGNALNFGEPVG